MSNGIKIEKIWILGSKLPGRVIKVNQQVEIRIRLKNESRMMSYNVISSRRRLFYDTKTHTLTIGLCDNEEAYEAVRKKTSNERESKRIRMDDPLPTILNLLPGRSTILKINLPLIIRRIFADLTNPFRIESWDISDLKKIECIVSYDSGAPHKKLNKDTGEFRPFKSWNFVKKVTIPKSGKESNIL